MTLKDKLLRDAEEFAERKGISMARVATIVAKDGKFFDRIAAGGRVSTDLYERFQAYFAENSVAAKTDAVVDG